MATLASSTPSIPDIFSIPLILALIAAGLAGNQFNLPIFLNVDVHFGSIVAMLALQCTGRYGIWSVQNE